MPSLRGIPAVDAARTKDSLEADLAALITPETPEQSAGQIADSLLRADSAAQYILVDPVARKVYASPNANFGGASGSLFSGVPNGMPGQFHVNLVPTAGQEGRNLTYEFDDAFDLAAPLAAIMQALVDPRKPTFTVASLVNAILAAYPAGGVPGVTGAAESPMILIDQFTGTVKVVFDEDSAALSAMSDYISANVAPNTHNTKVVSLPAVVDPEDPSPLVFEGGPTT